MTEEGAPTPRELFDEELAHTILGKSLLIGITHEDHEGVMLRRSQIFGRVVVADRVRGICIRTGGDGEETWFPPDTRGIKAAPPGEYRNRATGEVVKDPDFISSWTFTASSKKDGKVM